MSDTQTSTQTAIRLAPVVAIGLSFFVGNLDATVVNVATTQIGSDLNASTTELAWTVNGFVLAVAGLLLFAGDLAGRFGARRLYVWGLALFTVASIIAGAAPAAPVLIAARVLQGIGAALFQPAGLVLLGAAYPDTAVRQRMIGLWAAMGAAAAALGPMSGGFIVAGLRWRWIFWVNLPIGIIAIWMSLSILPNIPAQGRRVPVLGHLLFAVAVTGFAVALMQGPEAGWGAPVAIAGLAAAALGLMCFIWWQSRSTGEVYPGRVMRNRDFSLSNVVGVFMNVGLFGGVFLVSILLQRGMGSDPLTAGLQLLPMMVVFVIGNLAFSRFSERLGPKRAIILGMTAATITVAILAIASTSNVTYPWLATCLAVAHLGLGIASPAMTAAMMNSIEPRDTGLAGAVMNVNRQLGSLIGVAIAAGLLTTMATPEAVAPFMFGLTVVGYAIAAIAGLFLHPTDRSPKP